jgi:hypothetical protein
LSAVSSGFASVYVGSDGQAIADYDKALVINPKVQRLIINRGYDYSHLATSGRRVRIGKQRQD